MHACPALVVLVVGFGSFNRPQGSVDLLRGDLVLQRPEDQHVLEPTARDLLGSCSYLLHGLSALLFHLNIFLGLGPLAVLKSLEIRSIKVVYQIDKVLQQMRGLLVQQLMREIVKNPQRFVQMNHFLHPVRPLHG